MSLHRFYMCVWERQRGVREKERGETHLLGSCGLGWTNCISPVDGWIWNIVEIINGRRNPNCSEKDLSCCHFVTINPTWITLGLNLDLCVEKPASNCPCYGTAFRDLALSFIQCSKQDLPNSLSSSTLILHFMIKLQFQRSSNFVLRERSWHDEITSCFSFRYETLLQNRNVFCRYYRTALKGVDNGPSA
jgi:hypothetical protein